MSHNRTTFYVSVRRMQSRSVLYNVSSPSKLSHNWPSHIINMPCHKELMFSCAHPSSLVSLVPNFLAMIYPWRVVGRCPRHGCFPGVTMMFQCDGEYPLQFLFDFQLKIIGRLWSHVELIRNIWDRYDAQDAGSKAVSLLITALRS